ncbi:MAG: DUF3572 family protein [Alphaproteobacteria bacterium]|nr:MAG: DUF3572 family protein [Alphaproteobacteria bacterium]
MTGETLALHALEFIAADARRLRGFMAWSGVDEAGLRAGLARPEFLAGVLAYLRLDDRWMTAAAAHCGVAPEALTRAQGQLAPRSADV